MNFERFKNNEFLGVWLYLVAINVAIYVLQLVLGNSFTLSFALTPANALAMPWTFITAAFLHGSMSHIFFNMFSLFIFAPILEQKLGSKRFLLLYLVGAIAGNLGMFLMLSGSTIPGLGASGAIFAVLGALAVLEPNMVVFVSFFIPLPMWMAAIAWTILELIGTFDPSSPIGHWAHLGGLAFGLAYAFYLKKKIGDFEKEILVQ